MQEEKYPAGEFSTGDNADLVIGARVGERIVSALKDRSLTQLYLSKAFGVSPNNVSRYLSGRRPMPLWFVMGSAGLLGLNGNWLIYGEGPPGRRDVDWSLVAYEDLQAEAARQRLEFEKGLRKLQKAMEAASGTGAASPPAPEFHAPPAAEEAPFEVRELLEPAFREVGAETIRTEKGWRKSHVPVVDRLAAGKGREPIEAGQYPPGWAHTFIKFANPGEDRIAVRVAGPSMEPDYEMGDLVICDPAEAAQSGDVAVVLWTEIGRASCRDRV
jgi:SOS-response transcriptional repressor LexA